MNFFVLHQSQIKIYKNPICTKIRTLIHWTLCFLLFLFFSYNKSFSHSLECTRLPTHLGNKRPGDFQLKIHDERHNFSFSLKFLAITASQSEMCFYMYNSAYTYLQRVFLHLVLTVLPLTSFHPSKNQKLLCRNVGRFIRMIKSVLSANIITMWVSIASHG